jgi:hypothetical protein
MAMAPKFLSLPAGPEWLTMRRLPDGSPGPGLLDRIIIQDEDGADDTVAAHGPFGSRPLRSTAIGNGSAAEASDFGPPSLRSPQIPMCGPSSNLTDDQPRFCASKRSNHRDTENIEKTEIVSLHYAQVGRSFSRQRNGACVFLCVLCASVQQGCNNLFFLQVVSGN